VWFSPSDVVGISDFGGVRKVETRPQPFAADGWGEESVDAVPVAWRISHLLNGKGRERVCWKPESDNYPNRLMVLWAEGENRFKYYE